MPRNERAKQFAPFDALKGLQKALRLKEYEHDRMVRGDIDDETIDKISKQLQKIKKNDTLYIKYFEDGYYKELKEKVKRIDVNKREVELESKTIFFDDLFDLNIIK